jgi:acetyl-CoA acetyltransferase
MIEALEKKAAITGIGMSDVGRRLNRDPLELTADACLRAIADAGLKREDIDGISTYPGAGVAGAPGFTGAGVVDVQDMLRLNLNWYNGGLEQAGQLGSVITACAAVAAGYANHVLCFRTVWEATAQAGTRKPDLKKLKKEEAPAVVADPTKPKVSKGSGAMGMVPRASGTQQWSLPFGAASAAPWIALNAQRHFYKYGTTREALCTIAVNSRRNAGLNPKAVYKDPMTREDYFNARMISDPFCLFDCDAPCDASTAVIVSRADLAKNMRKPVIRVEAVGSAIHGRPSWDQWEDMTTMCLRDAAKMMWSRTDLKPKDVDVAELYDGFSFINLCWIEAVGLCGVGEAKDFLKDDRYINLDSKCPVNTHGGQLSAGRLHGYGFLHEACTQLWGEGGARQVKHAPQVAIAAAGGGPIGGCLLLRRD